MLLCLYGMTLFRRGRCHFTRGALRLRSALFYFIVKAAQCGFLIVLIIVASWLLVQLSELFS